MERSHQTEQTRPGTGRRSLHSGWETDGLMAPKESAFHSVFQHYRFFCSWKYSFCSLIFAVVLFLHLKGHLRGGGLLWVRKYCSLVSATCLQNSLGTTTYFILLFVFNVFLVVWGKTISKNPRITSENFSCSHQFFIILARWPFLRRSYFLSCLSG